SRTFIGPKGPAWVNQLLSPESLHKTGYFDAHLVARARHERLTRPRLSVRQLGLDMQLTSVVATQLWHHTFIGGGLCDLPRWEPPVSTYSLSGAADSHVL